MWGVPRLLPIIVTRNMSIDTNTGEAASPPNRTFYPFGCLAVVATALVLIALLLPAVHRGREPARRTQCRGHFKQIGLALYNYHDAYGAFPPAFTVDAAGNRLHSWRTLLLPYLNQKLLYDKIDLSKPWDDPANAFLHQEQVPQFLCPSAITSRGQTTCLALVTSQSVIRPESSCSIKDVKDGTSNTLTVIEVDAEHAVPWMSPYDADEALFLSLGPQSKLSHPGGFHALITDGAVRMLKRDLPADTRRALITVDGSEKIGDF